ncbi:MAG: hypothetical protein HY843_08300 [Bdellovibrio sp.]|nr:hypothetical protein [Bdellovibrio sp.]
MHRLATEIARGGVHDFDSFDDLAPYYFYPSVTYVTAGLGMLLSNGDNSEGIDPNQLKDLKKQISILLLNLFQEKNLAFLPMGGENYNATSYFSSLGYSNPFAGLALLPLIEKGCIFDIPPKSTLGILNINDSRLK